MIINTCTAAFEIDQRKNGNFNKSQGGYDFLKTFEFHKLGFQSDFVYPFKIIKLTTQIICKELCGNLMQS